MGEAHRDWEQEIGKGNRNDEQEAGNGGQDCQQGGRLIYNLPNIWLQDPCNIYNVISTEILQDISIIWQQLYNLLLKENFTPDASDLYAGIIPLLLSHLTGAARIPNQFQGTVKWNE